MSKSERNCESVRVNRRRYIARNLVYVCSGKYECIPIHLFHAHTKFNNHRQIDRGKRD